MITIMSKKIKDVDTTVIRDEFVHGYVDGDGVRKYPTIEALHKKHDVARATLYRISENENWQSQKNNYQTELRVRLDEERMERMISENKRLDDSCSQIAMGVITSIGRKIQRELELSRQNPSYEGLDSIQLNQLSSAMAQAQKVGKLALGQAQEISKVSADVSQPEAFASVLEQLDQIAESRASQNGGGIH